MSCHLSERAQSCRLVEIMSELYDNWCDEDRTRRRRKTLWRLSELEDGREHALDELPGRVLSHYVSDEEVAEFLETLGYPAAAECIRTLLPEGPIGRSGDLGEILAAEFVEERLGYDVPVRKLRDKDHRNMPMRGEDVIGVAHDDDDRLTLLKGEAKSAQALSRRDGRGGAHEAGRGLRKASRRTL